MSSQRCRLAADAFHHVAIATKGVDVVVEDFKARAVISFSEPLGGNRHARAIPNALPQRASRGFHTRGHAILGMSGSIAVNLTKLLDVVQADRVLTRTLIFWIHAANACQIEHGVQQHGSVAVGEDETVAVGPDRVFGVIAQKLLPQTISYGRQRHGRARMT